MFETERLVLRPFVGSDLDHLLRMWNQPEVRKGTSNDYLVPLSPTFKETLRGWVDKALLYVIVTLKSNGEFVGNVTINMGSSKNRDGTLGITLLQEYWGKGYGEEVLRTVLDHCFKACALHRITLDVFAGNERAVNLYRKLGFVEEGRRREGVWIDGAWQDVIGMGVLDREWAQLYWVKPASV